MNFIEQKAGIIQLPKFLDERGNLSVLETEKHVPFNFKRCYWIYDVPGGELRGSHAFKNQSEFIVALSGSFDALIFDGKQEKRYSLSRSYYGLYLPPMHYRTLDNFSTNSLALVVSSTSFDDEDYIWDKDEYSRLKELMLSNQTSSDEKKLSNNFIPKKIESSKTTIDDCVFMKLPRHSERSGSLTSLESYIDLPFEFRRIFYLYDIPGGENRGGHAHKECHQMLVSASGAFDVKVSDGINERVYRLDRPYYGLHIPPGIWAEELNFSSGSICLVLTSDEFNESDYWRNFDEYLKFKRG